MTEEIYLVGGFTGWRKDFINALPNIKFDNPIDHPQSSITKLNYSDTGSATIKPSLAYIEKGSRLGTMSYSELAVGRTTARPIIAVDENEIKDPILDLIASYKFENKQDAYNFLSQNPKLISNQNLIPQIDKTKSTEEYKSILFAGDFNKQIDELLHEQSAVYGRNCDVFNLKNNLEKIPEKYDLILVNFENENKHDPNALFLMGLGFQSKVPIIHLEGHNIPYPPLLGLARRVMIGPNRIEHAREYLKNLKSQHIKDEALVYYHLMKKFNQ
jgi:hypothetical protein